MYFATVLAGALLGSTVVGQAVSQAIQDVWRSIRYGQLTESEFIRSFGKPSEVRMFFADFTSMRDNGDSRDYRLTYPRSGTDTLLVGGPLGEAWDATVSVSPHGTVWRVEWRYVQGLRLHTRTGERSTTITLAQIQALAGRSPITVSKCTDAAGHLIQSDCGSYEFDVGALHLFVSYGGPGTDIDVSVESQRR